MINRLARSFQAWAPQGRSRLFSLSPRKRYRGSNRRAGLRAVLPARRTERRRYLSQDVIHIGFPERVERVDAHLLQPCDDGGADTLEGE